MWMYMSREPFFSVVFHLTDSRTSSPIDCYCRKVAPPLQRYNSDLISTYTGSEPSAPEKTPRQKTLISVLNTPAKSQTPLACISTNMGLWAPTEISILVLLDCRDDWRN